MDNKPTVSLICRLGRSIWWRLSHLEDRDGLVCFICGAPRTSQPNRKEGSRPIICGRRGMRGKPRFIYFFHNGTMWCKKDLPCGSANRRRRLTGSCGALECIHKLGEDVVQDTLTVWFPQSDGDILQDRVVLSKAATQGSFDSFGRSSARNTHQ